MRTAFAPTLAFVFVGLLVYSGLVLVGVPVIVAELVVLAATALASHQLGWLDDAPAGWLAIAPYATMALVVLLVLGSAPAQAADNTVSIPVDAWLNPVLEFLGLIVGGFAAWLVATLVSFLPGWLRPLINAGVQAALAGWIRQAINYMIQEVEGFDKGKVISFSVGSGALAVGLRFLIEHAPGWLLKLAGGEETIKAQILAALTEHGIVLDTGVTTKAVKQAVAPQGANADTLLKQIFAGK